MAAPRLVRSQSPEEVLALVREAMAQRRTMGAVYKGCGRLLAPFLLGRNASGEWNALCYQFGGESRSGLQHAGSADNWRCVQLRGLLDVELRQDQWPNPPNYNRLQTCISEVEFEVQI